MVVDAETAAQINVMQMNAFGLERIDHRQNTFQRFDERRRIEQLRTDMAINAGHFNRGECGRVAIERQSIGDRHTELVFLETSRDVGMRFGIDIRIDAQADRRALAKAGGDAGQTIQLAGGFDVEAEDARLQRGFHFRFGFTDAGEDDLFRVTAGGEHTRQLATRNDVETRTELCE